MKNLRSKFDWRLWVSIGTLVICFCFIGGVLAWALTTNAEEPSSRCLDSRYRIFERGNSFSVVEDVRCLNG